MTTVDPSSLNDDARRAWEANAGWWDERIGAEGNDFHRLLVAPAQLELLQLAPGEHVLDVACGNGQFAREMARAGASVLAFDFSAAFVERARQRTEEARVASIEYHVLDATDEGALLKLGAARFDAAVCTMALMDIATIDPLLRALMKLLKPAARFVFSVQHPCFNSTGCHPMAEEEDRQGDLVTTLSIRVLSYLDVPPQRGTGIVGQPEPHLYFHRTISELFNACFRAGFVLDGIAEPAFPASATSDSALRWHNFSQIPPVLVARLRAAN